jgi:hypothetical protein
MVPAGLQGALSKHAANSAAVAAIFFTVFFIPRN